MNFTYEAIHACTHVGFDLEHRLEKRDVHQLLGPLEVFAVVPFHHAVLQLTHSVRVAEDLEHPVFDRAHLAVQAVGENIILGRHRQLRREPLDGVDVDHALHVEQVDGDFHRVALADLVYGLDVRPVDELGNLVVVELERVLVLLQLLLLFLLVLVHPQNTAGRFLYYVHFVVGAILRLPPLYSRYVVGADRALLAI